MQQVNVVAGILRLEPFHVVDVSQDEGLGCCAALVTVSVPPAPQTINPFLTPLTHS
jgi:hypothetical protein